jgi:hypothetical protein
VSRWNGRYFRRGVYVACAMILCLVIVCIVLMGLSYDGQCGGYFPGLSGRRPCSLSEYMFGDVVAISVIMASAYWPVVVTLLLLPPFIGYWFDRKG